MSPILIAVCLSLTSAPENEKGVDFLQKSNAPPVTPGIPRRKNLGEQIDFFEKSLRLYRYLSRSVRDSDILSPLSRLLRLTIPANDAEIIEEIQVTNLTK